MKVIKLGITGGIASGKTRAAGYLRELGALTIDADLIAHSTYLPATPSYQKVIEAFGKDVVASDGTIDRRSLGMKVFGDASKLKQLTDIVWPATKDLVLETIEKLERESSPTTKVIVIEAALIVEARWFDVLDKLWVFVVPREVARERIVERNKFTPEEAEKRIASQLSNEERMKYADVCFETNRDPDEVKAKVVEEWNKLLLSCSSSSL